MSAEIVQFHPADCECAECEALPVYYVPVSCDQGDPQQEYREWSERMQRATRLWNKRRQWAEQADPWLVIERLHAGSAVQPPTDAEDLE